MINPKRYVAQLTAAFVCLGAPAYAQSPATPATAPAQPDAAQTAPTPPLPQAPTPPAPPSPHLAAGTAVIIELAEPVSSHTAKRGDMFAIRLSSPVTLDGAVLVPAGAIGKGQVVDSQSSDVLGKPAKLVLAARYLEVDGRHFPLKAMQLGAVGSDETNVVMAASFVPYAGMLSIFIRGGDITVPAGTHALAKLASDWDVTPPASAPVSTPANDHQGNNP